MFRRCKDQHGVVNCHRRKSHQVDDWRNAPLQCGVERQRCRLLMRARNREHHPPMASQHIGPPRSATFLFQQGRSRRAEFLQIGVAGNHDLFPRRATRPRIAFYHAANQIAANALITRLRPGFKSGVIEKLPRHPCQYETTMGISGFFLPRAEGGLPRRVEMIFPIGLVLEGECVAREIKLPQPGLLAVFQHKQLACTAN